MSDQYNEEEDMFVDVEQETDDETTDEENDDYDHDHDPDEEITEEYLFGDISDMADENATRSQLKKIQRQDLVTDLSLSDFSTFDTLDEDEKKYLPLNYIVSPYLEWRFVQEACASGFRSVSNLNRVSNKTIKSVADISQFAINNGTVKLPKLNQAFIDYALQRGI